MGQKVKVEIGNTAKHIGGDEYKWKVFLRSADEDYDIEDIFHEVTFDLHPTFNPPSVTRTESPFEVKRSGWGTFDIDITAKYCYGGQDDFKYTWELDFSEKKSSTIVKVKLPHARKARRRDGGAINAEESGCACTRGGVCDRQHASTRQAIPASFFKR
eukprot:TRINITY_DN29787_c0_g1_i1.p1 TRINITY_DN29787_c0_g1~~TRINITY_DN29787_c0_g1_i1.p1  ORF type:complete len:158 (+),score=24.70 TRINITY_DN29787_c0_g1_i1:55-528(+)